jgi:uncharacterized protein YndB with AHSA1/START domain
MHFEVQINAPREKVWEIMLGDETYREWTKAFNPSPDSNSRVEGNWEQGSKMLFIGPGEDGKEGGMVSRIKENRKPEFLSIEHLGILKDGKEDMDSEEAKKWSPAFENYTLTEKEGGTLLKVDQDMQEEYKEMFEGMWPKALEKLKELSEK